MDLNGRCGVCCGRLLSRDNFIHGRFEFVSLEAEWARFTLVRDFAIAVDEVKAVGPCGVSRLSRIAEFVEQRRNFNSQLAHAGACYESPFVFIARAGENDFVLEVAFHLPDVAWVRLGDVDDQELDAIAILLVELVECGNLPPKRWSGVASENKHDWFALRGQRRELDMIRVIESGEGEVGSRIANLQRSCARLLPHCFKGKHEEGDGAGNLRHHASERFGRTPHYAVDCAAADQPEECYDADGSYDSAHDAARFVIWVQRKSPTIRVPGL